MDAKELRIGNLITDYFREIVVDVNINILRSIKTNEKCLYKPIPLTEEWFDKFDFDKTIVEEYPIFQKDFLTIEYYSDKSIVYFGGLDVARTTIQYVHQLQNLYFVLCGKELILIK
jgi:hypothetical protein